jgi:hypothetical protein
MYICFLLSVSEINIKLVNPPHSSISYDKLAVWQREMQANSRKYLGYNSKTVCFQVYSGFQWDTSRSRTNCPDGEYVHWYMVFYATVNIISVISWRSAFFGGENRSTQGKKLTYRKSLLNLIT